MPDPLQLHSKKIRAGLSSAFSGKANDIHPTFGNTIYQQGSNVTGNLVGTAGAASGSLTVTRAGIGYTSAAASVASRDGDGHTVAGVALSAITGSGVNAVASVEYNEGSIVNASITSGGQGYQIGDVLGVTTDLGINGRLSVVSIASTSELIIDNDITKLLELNLLLFIAARFIKSQLSKVKHTKLYSIFNRKSIILILNLNLPE